jgi:serine/threonine-protein kinase
VRRALAKLLYRLLRVEPHPEGDADAIIILGAPLTKSGALSDVTEERVQAGVDLYKRGLARIVCVSGHRGEAEAMAERARALGVPDAALRIEPLARNTRENAMFCGELLAADGAKRVWLVSQPFHLRRALYWFRRAGFDARPHVIGESLQFRHPNRAFVWIAREYAAWVRTWFRLGVVVFCLSACSGGGGGNAKSPPPFSFQFSAGAPWLERVDDLDVSPESDTLIDTLEAAGGWGSGNRFRIDFSLHVLDGAAGDYREFDKTDDFFEPDCDDVEFPLPAGGAIEGENGYACTQDGDCHLLVADRPSRKLFEMWRADVQNGVFRGGCAVVWNLDQDYGADLRGPGCTSADASGLPIASLTPSPDEVQSGDVAHALRFILPNDRIRAGAYVAPATHSTSSVSGGADAMPYGVRLRLRADYPIEQNDNPAAQTLLRALRDYGMFLADAGSIALTFQSDRFTEQSWAGLGVDSFTLQALEPSDFEVIGLGAAIPYDEDTSCVRN